MVQKANRLPAFGALLFMAAAVFGADAGVTVNAAPEYGSGVYPEGFSFTGTASPWVSGIIREGLFYRLSLNVTVEYEGEELKKTPVLELGRAEISWRPFSALLLTAGRQRFTDAGALAVSGLFDGVSCAFGFGRGRLSAGGFYTGLLYKKSAEIIMTGADLEDYRKNLDYRDGESYFASRRALVFLSGEFPDLTRRSGLRVDVLAQFDLNGAAPLHSQYLVGRYGFRPVEPLALNLGGGAQLAEEEGADTQAGFAMFAGWDWELPGTLRDMFSSEVRWSGGAVNSRIGPFRPLNGIAQGLVLKAKLAGLMTAKALYKARFIDAVSAEAAFRYFIRTDTETFRDPELDAASVSRLLGGEAYASLIWAPDPAVQLSIGGGVFFPKTGSAFTGNAPVRWKAAGSLVMSF
jgi:hypothetical protein